MGKISRQNKIMLLFDIILIGISYIVALGFIHSFTEEATIMGSLQFGINLIAAEIIYILAYVFSRVYINIIQFATTRYFLWMVLWSAIAGAVIAVLAALLPQEFFLNVKANVLSAIFVTAFTVGVRVLIRFMYYGISNSTPSNKKIKVLIVGGGDAGGWIVRSITNSKTSSYDVCGIVDEDESKVGMFIDGKKILGTYKDIEKICRENDIKEIIMALPEASAEVRSKVYTICSRTGLAVNTIPSIDEMINSESSYDDAAYHIRQVKIEDLLPRKEVKLNDEQIVNEINNKVILVTGGGGSIGSELCRQIAKHGPKMLIVLDIYENNAYDLQNELTTKYPMLELRIIIASVRDYDKIVNVFNHYKPEIVFHAAAHKHVPLMEYNPGEAIKNNVFGTYNVAKASDNCGVKKMVLISTDKAVNPTNVMGATKRICEMIVQSMQEISRTEFVAVRFGNVLGSNGSVIPLFKKQIEEHKPITVTHKDITRFFMTIPEAAQLVLQAMCYAKGGEIFVLDMGQPVKIYDLAVNLIRLSGLKPYEDIDIKITGLRPGEKLYEELLMDEEGLQSTDNSKIFIGHPIFTNMDTLKKSLAKLEKAAVSDDEEYIKDIIADVVPTYVRDVKHTKKQKEDNRKIINA